MSIGIQQQVYWRQLPGAVLAAVAGAVTDAAAVAVAPDGCWQPWQ